jgi:hypothetical protein
VTRRKSPQPFPKGKGPVFRLPPEVGHTTQALHACQLGPPGFWPAASVGYLDPRHTAGRVIETRGSPEAGDLISGARTATRALTHTKESHRRRSQADTSSTLPTLNASDDLAATPLSLNTYTQARNWYLHSCKAPRARVLHPAAAPCLPRLSPPGLDPSLPAATSPPQHPPPTPYGRVLTTI